MAVTQVSDASNTAVSTSVTVTMPTHTTGDLILVCLTTAHGAPTANRHIYPPAGWHRGPQHSNGAGGTSVQLVCFWKIATSASESNPTFSCASSYNMAAYLGVFRGTDKVAPIRRYTADIGTGIIADPVDQNTEVAGTMAVICASWGASQLPAVISDGSWAEKWDTAVSLDIRATIYTKTFASVGATGSPNVTAGILGTQWVTQMLVIQPPDTSTKADVRAKAGTITCPGGTGDQDTTVGFDVKALLIWTIGVSDGNVAADAELMLGIGADDGVTGATQGSVGMWHDSGGTDHRGYSRNGEIVGYYTAGNGTLASPNMLATFSKITNGFRLNWTAVSSGKELRYLALGGADLRATIQTASADVANHTGFPWAPDVLISISQDIDGWTDQIRNFPNLMHAVSSKRGPAATWVLGGDSGGANFNHVTQAGAFGAQVLASALTWRGWVGNYLSNGFTWIGDGNADDIQVLGLYFNDKRYTVEVNVADGDASGTANTDQDDALFADGARIAAMHLFGADSASDEVDDTTGSTSIGTVQVRGGLDQYAGLFTRTGNTSERARDSAAAVLADSSGDIGSPGGSPTFERRGVYQDQDTIRWVLNNTTRQIYARVTFEDVESLAAMNPVFFGCNF